MRKRNQSPAPWLESSCIHTPTSVASPPIPGQTFDVRQAKGDRQQARVKQKTCNIKANASFHTAKRTHFTSAAAVQIPKCFSHAFSIHFCFPFIFLFSSFAYFSLPAFALELLTVVIVVVAGGFVVVRQVQWVSTAQQRAAFTPNDAAHKSLLNWD